jgi:hypothetical protein
MTEVHVQLITTLFSVICAVVCGLFYFRRDSLEQGRKESSLVTEARLLAHCSQEHGMRDKIITEHQAAFESRLCRIEAGTMAIASKLDATLIDLLQRVAVLEEQARQARSREEQ